MIRKKTKKIKVGELYVGGDAPITVQSMTNTVTQDIDNTVRQMLELEKNGCDIIRVAINTDEDAKAIKEIKKYIKMPIIGDIQFDYRLALSAVKYGVDGLRINPGNIGNEQKVKEIVKACNDANISIRIGVNSGSIKKE